MAKYSMYENGVNRKKRFILNPAQNDLDYFVEAAPSPLVLMRMA
jgi:hypothetical protein